MSGIPSSIGPYPVERELGRGGMGVVYLARDTRLDRAVAIKVLPDNLTHDRERLARFEREARILASLRHPGIAGIYGLEDVDGRRFLTLEYVEGDTLAERLARGPLPVDEALEVCRQMAVGIESAHEAGVIHRDLKPANVKITPAGEVKVLDFGLAKGGAAGSASDVDTHHSDTATHATTAAGVILGTAGYMSPEQARGKPVDRRTDIWSFGCVLYECLTGKQLFAGETVSDTIARILEREPDWSALPPQTPAMARDLLRRCLEKDAKRRLRDMGDARIQLEEALVENSSSGRRATAEAPDGGTARRRVPFAAIAVAGMVGLAFGAGFLINSARDARGTAAAEPICLTAAMPPGVTVQGAAITSDGRTLVVMGRPGNSDGSGSIPARIYTRRLDRYEFRELPGTEGVVSFLPSNDSRSLIFSSPVAPGAPQNRLARIPLDGSAPATTITDWKDNWSRFVELENGDVLISEDWEQSFVILPKAGGAPSSPMKIDSGLPGVSRYQFRGGNLPGDRGVLVDVVLYDTRGWHYSVGVMDPQNGKIKLVEENGGNARYSSTGHLVFTRGDAILAAPFDLDRLAERGPPVAVWSGLLAGATYAPGRFDLTRDGTLFYRPGQLGLDRAMALLDASGRLEPWAPERRALNSVPVISADGRRLACRILNARGIDEIWISSIDRPDFRRLETDPNADAFFPVWSPEGSRIAYLRQGKDEQDGIYIKEIDGGEPTRIFKPESRQVFYIPSSWLPDGTALLMARGERGKAKAVLLPIAGGEADSIRIRPILTGDFNQTETLLSPQGKLLAFRSNETGKSQTCVVEFHSGAAAGRPVQVMTAGSASHQWAADGRTLYVEDERGRLMKAAVTAGAELTVSAPVEVCDLEKLRVATWSVLPEGRFFVTLKNENEGEITHYDLVLNWTDELKGKLSAAP